MRAGIIQPNYIPWRGYFDFIASCDVFVVLDTVQYTKQDWRNRNRIKLHAGSVWLTVPIRACHEDTKILDVEVLEGWPASHRKMLEQSFCKSPYKRVAMDVWERGALESNNLAVIDLSLICSVCEFLGIGTKIVCASSLDAQGSKTDLVIDICEKVGADTYLSGPSAKYLDEGKMNDAGIGVEWKKYDYKPYEQPWGEFDGAVTVLDLIANTGPRAVEYL